MADDTTTTEPTVGTTASNIQASAATETAPGTLSAAAVTTDPVAEKPAEPEVSAPTVADLAADIAYLRETFGWPERPKDRAKA